MFLRDCWYVVGFSADLGQVAIEEKGDFPGVRGPREQRQRHRPPVYGRGGTIPCRRPSDARKERETSERAEIRQFTRCLPWS